MGVATWQHPGALRRNGLRRWADRHPARNSTARTVPARQTAPRFVGNPSAFSDAAMACNVDPERRNSTARSTAASSSGTGSQTPQPAPVATSAYVLAPVNVKLMVQF